MEDFLQQHVFSTLHAPFIGMAFVFTVIGQVMKAAVWTRYRAYQPGRCQWFWWWGYKTLAAHPVVAGAVLGLLWAAPEPGVLPGFESSLYFAGSGVLSVWLYDILKGAAKMRGFDLRVPGSSDRPAEDAG